MIFRVTQIVVFRVSPALLVNEEVDYQLFEISLLQVMSHTHYLAPVTIANHQLLIAMLSHRRVLVHRSTERLLLRLFLLHRLLLYLCCHRRRCVLGCRCRLILVVAVDGDERQLTDGLLVYLACTLHAPEACAKRLHGDMGVSTYAFESGNDLPTRDVHTMEDAVARVGLQKQVHEQMHHA